MYTTVIWGFPWSWGYPNSWLVYKGESHLEMDEDWGTPILGNPHLCIMNDIVNNWSYLCSNLAISLTRAPHWYVESECFPSGIFRIPVDPQGLVVAEYGWTGVDLWRNLAVKDGPFGKFGLSKHRKALFFLYKGSTPLASSRVLMMRLELEGSGKGSVGVFQVVK